MPVIFLVGPTASGKTNLSIKLARKYGHDKGRYEIITMTKSFHGRTIATITATGQDKVKIGFEPLPSGFAS